MIIIQFVIVYMYLLDSTMYCVIVNDLKLCIYSMQDQYKTTHHVVTAYLNLFSTSANFEDFD